jgi:ABC-type uncharacterized transport system permease subunit
VSSSWLAGFIHPACQDGTGSRVPAGVAGESPDESAEAAGEAHPRMSLISVMVAGVASGYGGALAVAQAAG